MTLDLKKIVKLIEKLEANKAAAIKKRDEALRQANAEISEMQSQLDELNKTRKTIEKLMAQQESELERITKKVDGFKKKGKAEEEEEPEEDVEDSEEDEAEDSEPENGEGTTSETEPPHSEEPWADLQEPEQKQNFFFHR